MALDRYLWEPGAGKVGGQGALIRPERFRGSVHTEDAVGLQRRERQEVL